MTTATAPAYITTRGSIKVEALTCTIGAELSNVSLGAASRDAELVAEIRSLLLKHKVVFFRDQDITRAEHIAFARHFGELEDHPVAGSDPDNPGLVRIYKSPDSPIDRYENAWHTDATWREKPPFGCVLRCVECPPVGGDTMWVNMVEAYNRLPEHVKTQIAGTARAPQHRGELRSAMPIEKRLALHAQFPDAEHPVVRTHPETGEKILFVNAFTTHFTNYHTPANVRFGQDANPGASQLLSYLGEPGLHPRVPGPLSLEEKQHGLLGQPEHPALRGDGLPALPPQDGTRRHHRRRHLLITGVI
jgi:taurine dioxygenase